MKILVIGSGGREHALVWKISQSPLVEKIYCAPGNGGIEKQAQCINIKADDIKELKNFALKEKIDLTVVGPEIPLVKGIVDEFEKAGLKVFGPNKKAAQLEGSKIFAKDLMKKYGIPTAEFEVFDNFKKAVSYIKSKKLPIVVKADGLAAGKGVIICKTQDEAIKAVTEIMEDKIFADAGNKVVIEECLEGEEASILAFTDGENIKLLPSSQDHKRIYDDDKGPNTGGMGAYSPAPIVNENLLAFVEKNIIKRTIDGLKKEGIVYKGILYAGLMIKDNKPSVLEFNVRFGDPETQAILPRIETDIVPLILATIDGTLNNVEYKIKNESCVCVVLASGGYPDSYQKGKVIKGLDKIEDSQNTIVFHAGTKKSESGDILTDGGRVLGVSALGKNIREAINNVYTSVGFINFENMHYRKDIGQRALRK
ncbi:MAG: phosphoribosylamine--glycine ligase [Candidatus Ratteibacteria bacterium]|nr:phosphoribosylamine--glycine ligase [Candidatus Ratteibacteria bacterium]